MKFLLTNSALYILHNGIVRSNNNFNDCLILVQQTVQHSQFIENLSSHLPQSGPLCGSVSDFQQVNVKLYTQTKRLIQGC